MAAKQDLANFIEFKLIKVQRKKTLDTGILMLFGHTLIPKRRKKTNKQEN